jgi:Family of unknown function (DUF695)
MQHGADTFSVMEGRSEGYPVVAMIRSQLQEYKAKGSTPWFFGFSTPLSRATPEGLPTAEEADDLNRWEDVIDRQMLAQCECVFVGRVTWKGHRELLYYVDAPEGAAQEIQKLIDADTMRPFAFRYERDADWTNVRIYLQ